MNKKWALEKAKEYIAEYHIDLMKYSVYSSSVDYNEYNRKFKTFHFDFKSEETGKSFSFWIEWLDGIEGYYNLHF